MADELQPRYSVVQKNDHFSFFDESGQSFVTLSITNTIPQAVAEEVPESFTEMEWLEAILGQGNVYGYLYTLKPEGEDISPLMGWISPDFQHVYPPCFDSTAFPSSATTPGGAATTCWPVWTAMHCTVTRRGTTL